MSVYGRIGRAGGTKVKRALGVQAALEWAFRVEQAQSACPMGQPISHPTKTGFSRRRERPFRIRRETTRPCEAIIEAQSGREIGA